MCVKESHRKKGIGKILFENILAYAHLLGIKEIYLLTTTAETFFNTVSFNKTNRENVPEIIRKTEEFKNLCPISAVCMFRKIDNDVQYFPKNILLLKPDVPGSKMWAVALEKTMFTYFEVEPNCIFEKHVHESEQITMVLEGVLFFKKGNDVFSVKKGEVIAIPSNVPHSVFTKDDFVKAVDAWSPVMNKYT